MLKLLWGPSWQANREVILSRICGGSLQKQQIWIVPEQASFEAEQLLCRRGGGSVSRYAQVLSFTRLCNRVLSVCGGIARQTMDQGGRVLAMAQALEQVRSRLKLYATGSHRPAFLPELLAAVDEFKSYGVTAEALQRAARLSGGPLAVKLEELALILESYDAVCAGARQDPRDRLSYLCRVLETSDFAADKTFYLDGFQDFTGVELQIIQQLLQAGADVTVCLCCDGLLQGQPVFETCRSTSRALILAADRAGQQTFTEEVPQPEPGELAFAASHVFGASDQVWPRRAEQIHLRQCADEFEEAQAVAATVIQLLHQGCAYSDIVIAAADYPACRTVYDTVLGQYGIPMYFAGSSPILNEPVFEMVCAALEAATGGLERDAVIGWLKSGLSGVEWGDADALENYAITWNISGSRWETDWTSHPAGYDARWRQEDQELLNRLNQARTAALTPLCRLRDSLKQSTTVGQMVQNLYDFLEELHLDTQLQQQAQEQYAQGQLQQAQKSAQLYEILISALEQMYALLENVPATAESFFQLLQVLLSQYDAGTIPASADCVICGGIADLRSHSQKVLLLTGCREGLLPAYRSESGLLSEQERNQLLDYGISLAPDAWGSLSRDLAVLYTVLRSADAHIFWFASADDPSYLFLRMQQLFPDRDPAAEAGQYPADLVNPRALAAAAVRQEPEEFAPQAVRLLPDAQVLQRMQQLRCQAGYAPGGLERETVRGLYGEKIFLSASQIQTFAACRQAHFLQYGIQAKKRAQAEFDAPIYGTFVHEVLEKTVRQVQEEGGFAAVAPERVEEIAREHIDTFTQTHCSQPEQQTPRFVYLYERNFDEIMQVIRELDQELRVCKFEPARFELRFSAGTAMGPVEIRGDLGTAQISGAVDRVDLLHAPHGDFVRVVDYKTGTKDFDYTDLLCGMGLQMLIYLFALEEKGQREFGAPVKPAGVLYFPARCQIMSVPKALDAAGIGKKRQEDLKRKGLLLDDPYLLQAMEPCEDSPKYLPYQVGKNGATGDLASSRQLQLLRRHVKRVLQQFTDEIFDGNITPNPYDRGKLTACSYCDYADACHRDRNLPRARKLRAVKAEEFWRELEREEVERDG